MKSILKLSLVVLSACSISSAVYHGSNERTIQSGSHFKTMMEIVPLAHSSTPSNGDKYRAFFVWHFNAHDSVIQSDAYLQQLIDICQRDNYNLIFLGVEPFLSPKYYSLANELAIRKVVKGLRQSGIEVHALMGQGGPFGDPYARKPIGYGTNIQWAVDNIILPVQDYNSRAPDDSKFSGFLIDNEYYNKGKRTYNVAEAIGTLDLLRLAKQMLPELKIGHTPSWLLSNQNNCNHIIYNGKEALEGFHIMNQSDYIVVQIYKNDPDNQIKLLNPWIEYASTLNHDVGIMIASDVDNPKDINYNFTYNTLTDGDKLRLEGSLHKISRIVHAKNNNVWWGNAIEMYDAYKDLK